MNAVIASIHFTFLDLWHHRIISFACALITAFWSIGSFFSMLIVSGHVKVLIDFYCAAHHFFVIIFPFIFILQFFKRLEDTHFYHWFLISGCPRSAFLLGAFCAFFLVLSASAFLFFCSMLFFMRYQTGFWFFYLWPVFLLHVLEGTLLVSFALFWSMILSLYWACA